MDANNDGHPITRCRRRDLRLPVHVPNSRGDVLVPPARARAHRCPDSPGAGGAFLVEDEDELALRKALALEVGVTDIPLVSRTSGLTNTAHRSTARRPRMGYGYLGNDVLLNLTPRPFLDATARYTDFAC